MSSRIDWAQSSAAPNVPTIATGNLTSRYANARQPVASLSAEPSQPNSPGRRRNGGGSSTRALTIERPSLRCSCPTDRPPRTVTAISGNPRKVIANKTPNMRQMAMPQKPTNASGAHTIR